MEGAPNILLVFLKFRYMLLQRYSYPPAAQKKLTTRSERYESAASNPVKYEMGFNMEEVNIKQYWQAGSFSYSGGLTKLIAFVVVQNSKASSPISWPNPLSFIPPNGTLALSMAQ